jgi:very-short-patch-repair endonuclease
MPSFASADNVIRPSFSLGDAQAPESAEERRERERLTGLFEGLRKKLLDLTLRNPMLSYKPRSNSRRHLRIVDDIPEDVYARLTNEGLTLDVVALPDLPDIPVDEQTEDFLSMLSHMKASDAKYLAALKELAATGRDDEFELARLERGLRDQVRKALELPPRPTRKQFDLAEHAQQNDIDPSEELKSDGKKAGDRRKRLQTLFFAEPLQTRLEAVQDLARLAQQEMGLSTLFMALGFLEWRQSDASDKSLFAPLLLLPVVLEHRIEKGKKIHSIRATSEEPEINVTLAEYLREKENRKLPEFDSGEESKAPIEEYLALVAEAVEGLPNWRVRRFLTLGHFAFGRLAMYKDIDPQSWPEGIARHALVRSVLQGFEAVKPEEGAGLSPAPKDYDVDNPEFEKLAPLLAHDADASQHSAIIDVMKGQNLVIEGPPGTGKSQTITNIIANALSREKPASVLFLSEKLAALKVVKRRLDVAGLGDFCFELHSDESSPRSVVGSLAKARDRRASGKAGGAAPMNVAQWDDARREIASYLDALHDRADDGETAFQLFWQSIALKSKLEGAANDLLKVSLPASVLQSQDGRTEIAGLISHHANIVAQFIAMSGRPSESIWAVMGVNATLGQVDEIFELISEIRDANRRLLEVEVRAEAAGLGLDELALASKRLPAVADPPDLRDVDRLAACSPHTALRVIEAAKGIVEAKLGQSACRVEGSLPEAVFQAARDLHGALWERNLENLTVAEIVERADGAAKIAEAVADRIACVEPIARALKLGDAAEFSAIPAICFAAKAAASIADPAMRPWLGWTPSGGIDTFEAVRARWEALCDADRQWTERMGEGYSPETRPDPNEIRSYASVMDANWFVRLWYSGEVAKAKRLVAGMGLDDRPESEAKAVLLDFAEHLERIGAFENDRHAADAVGSRWNGVRSDFAGMGFSVKARRRLSELFAQHGFSVSVANALFALAADEFDRLAGMRPQAERHIALPAEERQWAEGCTFAEARERAAETLRLAKAVREAAMDTRLEGLESPLRDIVKFSEFQRRVRDLNKTVESVAGGAEIRDLVESFDDAERLSRAASWAKGLVEAQLSQRVVDYLIHPDGSQRLSVLRLDSEAAAKSTDDFRSATARAEKSFGIWLPMTDPAALAATFDRLEGAGWQLADYLALRQARSGLVAAGLGDFVDALDRADVEPADHLTIFENVVVARRAEAARKAAPALKNASGMTLNSHRASFAKEDVNKIKRDRRIAADRMMRGATPDGVKKGPQKNWTEMALINNEIKKLDGNEQKKHARFTPVRSLLGRAPVSVRGLKPCFMMSPLSVSKFLPREMKFDLVIIDEASQMRPEDALGALLRAGQIVVVGDPRQLPPTDFFNRAVEGSDGGDGDDGAEDIDDESILEACGRAFNKVRRLKWHYRSRCESLIAFSNEQFYNRSLITFPMARPGSFSIDLVRVDGRYEASQNPAEAQRICEEAIDLMHRLANAPKDEFGTVGIVAVNSQQREVIWDKFSQLSSGDEFVERFMQRADEAGEPFFVKNLENVQGDERDFIMISLTYGRQPGKDKVNQTFGPINRIQGHRRLNVLFSRARRRIGLFTSMSSADIRPSETSKRGVHVLKAYLEYAERGHAAPGQVTGRAFESPFEEEVCRRLEAKGYTVDLQVGVSNFRIDLGIRHPKQPSIYLCGVECDGAAFHSSRSARDRDRLREEVLRGLGWDLVRIWSTDWFSNPDTATETLIARIKALESKPLRQDDEVVFGAGATREKFIEDEGAPVGGGATAPVATDDGIDVTAAPAKPAAPDMFSVADSPSSIQPRRTILSLPQKQQRPTPAPTKQAQPDLFSRAASGQADLFAEDSPKTVGQTVAPPKAPPSPSLLAGTGKLTSEEARRALVELREIIAAEMPDAEPHRCILRDTMIECFLREGLIDDPQQRWFKLPPHLRTGTDPVQKKKYLDQICDVLDRKTG